MTDLDQKRQTARHLRLIKLLAEIYWKSTPPFPGLAVKAAAAFSGLTEEQAKKKLEELE